MRRSLIVMGPIVLVLAVALGSPAGASTAAAPTEPPAPTCAHPTIVGTPGNDVIVGTPGPDVIDAGAGDDIVYGGGGDDVICGGDGRDFLDGGPGNDLISGGAGADTIAAGAGSDTIWGGDGPDRLYATDIVPTTGVDTGSTDTLYSGGGPDQLFLDDSTGHLFTNLYGGSTLRGHPGVGTVVTGVVTVEIPRSASEPSQVTADLGQGWVAVDQSRARIEGSTSLAVDGRLSRLPVTVEVSGSRRHDDVHLSGVTTASVHLGGGSDVVTLDGGSRLQGADLDLGTDRNFLEVQPDVAQTVVDLAARTVAYDGRPVVTLRGVEDVEAGFGGAVRPAASISLLGDASPNYLNATSDFASVTLDGRGGDDGLQLIPTASPDTPAVRMDGGPGNDDLESRQVGGTLLEDGGQGDDVLRTTLTSGVLHGGPGTDTCHLQRPTPHASCEVVLPVWP